MVNSRRHRSEIRQTTDRGGRRGPPGVHFRKAGATRVASIAFLGVGGTGMKRDPVPEAFPDRRARGWEWAAANVGE